MLQLINLNELGISPETMQTSYLQTEVGFLKVMWCEEGIFTSEFVDDDLPGLMHSTARLFKLFA